MFISFILLISYFSCRYLCVLKNLVRNRAYPEGSIAEGYISNESLIFCSRYLSNVETRHNRLVRNDDSNTSKDVDEESLLYAPGRPLGRSTQQEFDGRKRKRVPYFELDRLSYDQAHRYVLFNSDEVNSFIE